MSTKQESKSEIRGFPCPHCKKEIHLSPTEWSIWYRDNLRQRLNEVIGDKNLDNLLHPSEVGGPYGRLLKCCEEILGAVVLAYFRGMAAEKETTAQQGTKCSKRTRQKK